MFHYIKGQLAMKFDGGVVVETGGIGYEIFVPENSAIYLSKEGDSVMLYLYMAVREDDVSLYGFSERESLKLFKQLITVSGVGAKAGMSILSAMPLNECKRAIIFEDVDTLTKANGIGKKTAQRIVLELRDKVDKLGIMDVSGNNSMDGMAGKDAVRDIQAGDNNERMEAINALIALGYSKSEAMSAINTVTERDLTSQQYIKQALKQLF